MRKALTQRGLRKGVDTASLREAVEQYKAAASQRRRDQIRAKRANRL
jgi:hypothetical protein